MSKRLSADLDRIAGGLRHGVMSALAAICAYLPAQALGLHEAFWSALTAISVVQTEFHATENSARNQFLGGIIGGLVGLCLLLGLGEHLAVYLAAVVLAIILCWALNVPSASQLSGITATIIMLVPHTGAPQTMLVARLSEVGWGIAMGIAVVWLAAKLPAPKWYRFLLRK